MLTAAFFLLSLVVASSALAVPRDPFDPLITPGQTSGNSDGGDTGTGTVDGNDGDVFVPGENEPLPNTGGNVDGWFVLSYGLIAAGVTALTVHQMRQPIKLR
jgi:hypothetical protein